ncbi:MAG: hypothetical protein LQ338_002942 [Usnochroma carphineum]|nr:MAG: hypothetical protein LQ338_002942 [Usnochroma carphineum]
MTSEGLDANTGRFNWFPAYKQEAQILPSKDVFLLVLGTLKAIAPFPGTDRVDGAFNVGSQCVNANLQVYLHNRRVPRPFPPFFQYAHVLEAVRRISAWILDQRRFAEFLCNIEVSTKPVGRILVEKGPFRPPSTEPIGNVTIS